MSHREHLLSGEALGQRYALAVPQTALAGATGNQLGRRAGTSIDFQDYREGVTLAEGFAGEEMLAGGHGI